MTKENLEVLVMLKDTIEGILSIEKAKEALVNGSNICDNSLLDFLPKEEVQELQAKTERMYSDVFDRKQNELEKRLRNIMKSHFSLR